MVGSLLNKVDSSGSSGLSNVPSLSVVERVVLVGAEDVSVELEVPPHGGLLHQVQVFLLNLRELVSVVSRGSG